MAINTVVKADHHAPPITEMLARFAVSHPSRGWSDAVEREAHRTFANWVGCAIGPSGHETMVAALAAVMELAPAGQAAVLGRRDRVDMASAALLNGISSHTFDFDDTHLKTIIHPAGPVASAIVALAEHTGASGRECIDALVLGIDLACRVGNAMYPEHYDRGWHITGSTGTLGAAAACARLLKLDTQQTAMAPEHAPTTVSNATMVKLSVVNGETIRLCATTRHFAVSRGLSPAGGLSNSPIPISPTSRSRAPVARAGAARSNQFSLKLSTLSCPVRISISWRVPFSSNIRGPFAPSISRPLSARMVARCSLSRASSTMIPRRLPSADLARTYTTSSSDTLVNTPSCNRKAAMWLRISHWYSRNDAALAGTSHMFNAKCAAIVTAAWRRV